MKQYISYLINETDPDKQEIMVAMLEDFGFDGFEQTATQLIANGYKETLEEAQIEEYLKGQDIDFVKNILDEENWNEKWERSFQPIVIDDFCAVRASFHEPIVGVKHEIIITPKMSFGTGHHATTWMMMKAMEGIDFNTKNVIDFGAGTGILAILAEKIGAVKIVAIDYDDWCIENGKENIDSNNCRNIRLLKSDHIVSDEKTDIILANINKNVIIANFPALKFLLKKNGVLLISGILVADEADILAVTESLKLEHVKTFERNGWLCILFHNVA